MRLPSGDFPIMSTVYPLLFIKFAVCSGTNYKDSGSRNRACFCRLNGAGFYLSILSLSVRNNKIFD